MAWRVRDAGEARRDTFGLVSLSGIVAAPSCMRFSRTRLTTPFTGDVRPEPASPGWLRFDGRGLEPEPPASPRQSPTQPTFTWVMTDIDARLRRPPARPDRAPGFVCFSVDRVVVVGGERCPGLGFSGQASPIWSDWIVKPAWMMRVKTQGRPMGQGKEPSGELVCSAASGRARPCLAHGRSESPAPARDLARGPAGTVCTAIAKGLV